MAKYTVSKRTDDGWEGCRKYERVGLAEIALKEAREAGKKVVLNRWHLGVRSIRRKDGTWKRVSKPARQAVRKKAASRRLRRVVKS